MIIDKKPLAIVEALDYIKDLDDKPVLKEYFDKFVKIKSKEAEEIRKKITSLNSPKIRDEHIAKIIDLMPKDSESVNKIFLELSLSEEETKSLIDIVKGN